MKIDDVTYEDFNSSLTKNNILDNHYRTSGEGLILFNKECKQNKLTTLMDLLEYYNKMYVKPLLQAVSNQRETFYEFNIDIFKDFFTVSSIAKHMLAIFSEIYYQYRINTESILGGLNSTVASTKIDREYIVTKIRNYYDSERKEKRRCIPLTLNEIIHIINREHQRCYYCKMLLSDWTFNRLNNKIGHQASNCVLCCVTCNKAKCSQPFFEFLDKKNYELLNKNSTICLIEDEKVGETIKMGIVGGLSIVFHRYHKVGKTMIRKPYYNGSQWFVFETEKLVYKIQGHDANALYLYCLTQPQLCGKLIYYEYKNEDLCKLFGLIIVNIEELPKYYNYFSEFPLIFVNFNKCQRTEWCNMQRA